MKIFSHKKLAEVLADPRINASAVARMAKIDPTSLWLISKGKRIPKINTLAAIAHALDKPTDYFLEEESVLAQQELPLQTKGRLAHG